MGFVGSAHRNEETMTKEEKYQEWIQQLAMFQGGRPHFSDQTPESMILLEKLVRMYAPSMIIELGTAHGLSTRLWLEQTEGIPIICVDAGFDPLRGSSAVLPVDFSRLTLKETWVRAVDLKSLWAGQSCVLLYVDVHSDHDHVLKSIPDLPQTSVVIFDDVWRSSRKLETQEQRDEFVKAVVEPQIDYTAPKAIWPLCYADYWKNGGFWGFQEVPLLCDWVAANHVRLHWEAGAKLVWFQWPQDKEA